MTALTHRKRFLNLINGEKVDKVPFFPDLSKWYEANRYGEGPRERNYLPGELIAPEDTINRLPGQALPARFRGKNIFEIHAALDCGIPVHGYDIFYKTTYRNSEIIEKHSPERVTTVIRTSKGELREIKGMAADHSQAILEHFVKSEGDLDILTHIVQDTVYSPNFGRVEKALSIIGESGYLNLIIPRSPMGRLIHNYMGVEAVTYALMDYPEKMQCLLDIMREKDREVWTLATAAPGKIAFMADNMDEFLISPDWYRSYFLPVYQEMNALLHRANKKVLTHMDGRLKNILPMIPDSGFDVLDGCTPSPVGNYEPRELYAALGRGQYAYCGVPAALFIEENSERRVLDFTRKILDEMGDKLILNVGDIMPEKGNIDIIEKMSDRVNQR
ncbi:MAG: hypothetical protein A2293_13660 [Elusimicrobia bacterium RIFOXYB2_FULL_49_7]|nr:MAG: hypothetical protein A2293_13660 [Elusimicrobia bacterium RIFOXYB2_FULL_49_7]